MAKTIKILLFAMVLIAFATGCALAEEITRDGVIYEIEGDNAYIVAFAEKADEVIIPAKLDGKPVRYRLREDWISYNVRKLVIEEGVTSIPDQLFDNWYIEELELPSSLREIGQMAFAWTKGYDTLVIPEGVETIGENAFYYTGVQKIILPSTARYVEVGAFGGNEQLIEFVVHEANPSFCARDGALYSKDGKTLTDYPAGKGTTWTIPEGTEHILEYAFQSAKLESLRIGEGLTVLSNEALSGCYNLRELYLPSSIQQIEENALPYLNLRLIEIAGENAYFETDGYALYQKPNKALVYFYNEEVTSYSVRPGTMRILPYAFIRKDKLESVTIPRSVTAIENGTFSACTALRTVQLPITIETIGESAFARCFSLERIILPVNLKRIEGYAFSSCMALTEISIPDHIAFIGPFAFEDCMDLVLTAKSGTLGENFAELFRIQKNRRLIEMGQEAQSSYYGIVFNDSKDTTLNLQSEARQGADTIGQFKNGTTVRILSREGEWFHVMIGDDEGYLEGSQVFQMMDFYWVFSPQAGTAMKSVQALRYPLEGSNPVFLVQKGETVRIVEAAGSWYKIEIGGKEGYVLTTDVDVELPEWLDERVGIVTNPDYRDRLHLRVEPSTNADSLGRFYNGVQVTILSELDEWYQVSVGFSEGYMMKKFVHLVD